MLYVEDHQTNTAFFYYFWQSPHCNVWENRSHPIICSIATLRYFCRRAPIYVIDVSHDAYWGSFPQQLKFTVIPRKHFLSNWTLPNGSPIDSIDSFGALVFSKVFDVYAASLQIPENRIVVCDTDVFWLADPFPFQYHNGFCMDGGNSGFWYYHKDDLLYMGILMSHLFGSIVSPEMAKHIRNTVATDTGRNADDFWFLEETVMRYVCSRIPGYNRLSHEEHFIVHHFNRDNLDLNDIKNVHVMSYAVNGDRLSFISQLREIVNAMKKVLTPEQLLMVLGTECAPKLSYRDRKEILQYLHVLRERTSAK